MGDKNSWVSQDRLAKYKEGLKSSTSTTPQPAASPPAAASAQAQKPRRVFHERYFERYSTTLGDWESIEDPMPAVPLSSIQSIKCVSYNVWFVDRFFDERREALCNILRDERPDVICLQEITERFLQYIISLQWVQDEYLISDTRGTTVHPYGVLMLTKLPVKRLTFHPLQSRMGRKLLLLELSLSDSTMAIGTVHLESMDNTSKRCQQLLYILDECLKEFEHAMLMGDFNFHEVSPENDECLATHPEYVDIWPYLHHEDGHTVTETRTRFSGFRIDRMLIRSDHFFPTLIERIGREPILTDTVVNADGVTETEPIFPSDHYGLCSVVEPLQLDDD